VLEALSSVVIDTENSPDPVPGAGRAPRGRVCSLVCKARPNIETSFLLCQDIQFPLYQGLDMIDSIVKVGLKGTWFHS